MDKYFKYYELLGLPYGASLKEVRRKSISLLFYWCPYKPSEIAIEKSKGIIEAYEKLKERLKDSDKNHTKDNPKEYYSYTEGEFYIYNIDLYYYGPGYDPMMDFWESEEHYNSVVKEKMNYYTFNYNVFDKSIPMNNIIQVIMLPGLIIIAIYIIYKIISILSGVVLLLFSLTLAELISIILLIVLIVKFKEINQSLTKIFYQSKN